jgi:hypothetical protein
MPCIAGALSCILLIAVFDLYQKQSQFERFNDPDRFDYTTVYIPLGSFDDRLYKQFAPFEIQVILYNETCCGAVRWVNEDILPFKLEATDDADQEFYKATRDLYIKPGDSFKFIFDEPGEYSFMGRPMQQGIVFARPCNCD